MTQGDLRKKALPYQIIICNVSRPVPCYVHRIVCATARPPHLFYFMCLLCSLNAEFYLRYLTPFYLSRGGRGSANKHFSGILKTRASVAVRRGREELLPPSVLSHPLSCVPGGIASVPVIHHVLQLSYYDPCVLLILCPDTRTGPLCIFISL